MPADDAFYGDVVPGDLFVSTVADASVLVISVRKATLAETHFAESTASQRRSHRAATPYNFVTVCVLCRSSTDAFDDGFVHRTAHANVCFADGEFWTRIGTPAAHPREDDKGKKKR